jgi:hypothetical protein
MTETRTIEPNDAEDLMWDWSAGGTGGWTKVGTQHISEHRWHDRHWLVLRRRDDGTYWGLMYEQGKTEMQETQWPWDKAAGPLKLTRLYPHKVTRVEYREDAPKEDE